MTHLVIGDYNLSSWSLRAWLVLKSADVSFDTVQVKLEQQETRQQILHYSPSGRVPVLLQDGLVINDSLAISEYMADVYPAANLWPEDPRLKALARAASAEMHSGFVCLRTQMSFGLNTGDTPETLSADTLEEIERVFAIWSQLLSASQSTAFLCGPFGIVDAMFAPVVFRFRRYGIAVPEPLRGYTERVLTYPPVQQWLKLAAHEV